MVTALKTRQVFTFIVTWLSYASTYLLRKPLGVIKPDLEKTLHLKKSEMGWLDASLLFPYAVMQMLLGGLGDKIGARKALTICLIGSAFSMITFGYWQHVLMLSLLLFLNGTFQANAWPNCVKCLSSWYSDEHRASIFGLWGTCTFAGGIIGTSLAVYLQSVYSPDLKMIFITPSLILLSIGILVFLTMKMPSELNITIPGKEELTGSTSKSDKILGFSEVIRLNLVPELVVTVICVKLVRYCLYMWLPMYLHEALKYSKAQAGMLSTTFEIGGVLGSALIGVFINKVLNGHVLYGCSLSLFLSAMALVAFQITSTWGIIFNITSMLIAGVCNCGPDPLLTGSIPAKIGEKVNAQAAVAGVVNGFGGAGAIVEGPLIGLIVDYYGWSGAFYFMVLLSILATFSILKASRNTAT
ncbi:putative glycerol-3-phosphate transporter 5 [Dendronephthya gigantea]|uniref:putative glycerol-3-phosphate transporter 5 n=1 Tax=Dendronephthya gigantea TaxID=151771 RepID=UPI00106D0C4B|nr:putative glycerol-3-phosphate transporter 5 [Dendronephthya gigantea]